MAGTTGTIQADAQLSFFAGANVNTTSGMVLADMVFGQLAAAEWLASQDNGMHVC